MINGIGCKEKQYMIEQNFFFEISNETKPHMPKTKPKNEKITYITLCTIATGVQSIERR